MSPPDCADSGHVDDIEQTYIPIDGITSPDKHEADYNTGYGTINPDPNIISASDYKNISKSVSNSSSYRTPECLDINNTYCSNELEPGAMDPGKWKPVDEGPLQTYIDTGEFEKKTDTASGETKEGFRRGKPKKTCVSIQECYETVNNKTNTTSYIVIVLLVCIALSIGMVFMFRKVRKDSGSVTTQPQAAKR